MLSRSVLLQSLSLRRCCKTPTAPLTLSKVYRFKNQPARWQSRGRDGADNLFLDVYYCIIPVCFIGGGVIGGYCYPPYDDDNKVTFVGTACGSVLGACMGGFIGILSPILLPAILITIPVYGIARVLKQ